MQRVSGRMPWAPRVYYIAGGLALALWAGAGAAALEPTGAPSMVTGAPDAPVTIVEFSDYQ